MPTIWLTTLTYPSGEIVSTAYNAVGNLTFKTGVAGTGALGYNDAAHKHAVTHGTWGPIAEYDANGNMTHHWDYPNGLARWYRQDWDADNRLTAVRDESYNLLVQFSYDADGNRVRKVANGQTTAYIGNH